MKRLTCINGNVGRGKIGAFGTVVTMSDRVGKDSSQSWLDEVEGQKVAFVDRSLRPS